jgi:hypothetical protein
MILCNDVEDIKHDDSWLVRWVITWDFHRLTTKAGHREKKLVVLMFDT